MTYDWRLSMAELEARDGYFTRLRKTIERQHAIMGRRAVIVAHSYGGNVVFDGFFRWIDEQQKDWYNTHVECVVPIAPPLLGAPKNVAFLQTGAALGRAAELAGLPPAAAAAASSHRPATLALGRATAVSPLAAARPQASLQIVCSTSLSL